MSDERFDHFIQKKDSALFSYFKAFKGLSMKDFILVLLSTF